MVGENTSRLVPPAAASLICTATDGPELWPEFMAELRRLARAHAAAP